MKLSVLSESQVDGRVVRRVMELLEAEKPHLFAVVTACFAELKLREHELSRYKHTVSRGFYKRIADELGISQSTASYRLNAAFTWIEERLKRYGQI